MTNKKPVIVGIDPGSTIGIAILNFNGEIIDLMSGKNLSLKDIVFALQEYEPTIIGTDRVPAPKIIKKLCSIFKAKLYLPKRPLERLEKSKIIQGYNFKNQHEADALASALKAYMSFSGKIRQIKKQEGANFENMIKKRLFEKRSSESFLMAKSNNKNKEVDSDDGESKRDLHRKKRANEIHFGSNSGV
ncbi:MAG: DUF460 domain-containing protein [archaeon]